MVPAPSIHPARPGPAPYPPPAPRRHRHPSPATRQFAFNTLERVSPVSHGVCNVVKRVAIIFSSVVFFNQVLTSQALIGTVIALAGTWLYTDLSSKHKKKPAAPPPPPAGLTPAAA